MFGDDIRVKREFLWSQFMDKRNGFWPDFGSRCMSNNSRISGLFDLLHWHNVLW